MAQVSGSVTSILNAHKFIIKRGADDYVDITYEDLEKQIKTPASAGTGTILDTDRITVVHSNGTTNTFTYLELKNQITNSLSNKASGITANLLETRVDGSVQAELIDLKAKTIEVPEVTVTITDLIDADTILVKTSTGYKKMAYSDLLVKIKSGQELTGIEAAVTTIADDQLFLVKRTDGKYVSITWSALKSVLPTQKASDVPANLTDAKVDGTVQAEIIDIKAAATTLSGKVTTLEGKTIEVPEVTTTITTITDTDTILVKTASGYEKMAYSDLLAKVKSGQELAGIEAAVTSILDTENLLVKRSDGKYVSITWAEVKALIPHTTLNASGLTADLTASRVENSIQDALLDNRESILALAEHSTIVFANDGTLVEWGNITNIDWSSPVVSNDTTLALWTDSEQTTNTTGWTTTQQGRMWFNTTNKQFMGWNGTNSIIIG